MHFTVWPIDGTIAHPTKEPHQFSLIVSTCCNSVAGVRSLRACVYMHMCVHLWASSHQNKGSCRNTIAKVFLISWNVASLGVQILSPSPGSASDRRHNLSFKNGNKHGKKLYASGVIHLKKKIPLAAWISKFSDRTFISMLGNHCFTAEFQPLVNCQRFTFNVFAFVKKHKYLKELNWFK